MAPMVSLVAINYPCPNFKGVAVRTWISSHITMFCKDATTYPCRCWFKQSPLVKQATRNKPALVRAEGQSSMLNDMGIDLGEKKNRGQWVKEELLGQFTHQNISNKITAPRLALHFVSNLEWENGHRYICACVRIIFSEFGRFSTNEHERMIG